MGKKELYIIGNGFDIHHGIPSGYSNFREFLRIKDNHIYDLVDEYLPVDEKWADIEECLAHIDVDNVIENASQFLVSYGAEDWSDSFHHDYQYEVNRVIEGLSSGLLAMFTEWVIQLEIPAIDEVKGRLVNLQKEGIYLTFNYTNTLNKIYGIANEDILYIHGNSQYDNDLVLGHAWHPASIPKVGENTDPESMDTRVMEGNEIINQFFGSTFKNTEAIMQENESFFTGLDDVSIINIMGHSMSEVDFDYFYKITKSVNISKVKWRVSYYDQLGLEARKSSMNALGITDKLITYLELRIM
jgi:hypothetical protein